MYNLSLQCNIVVEATFQKDRSGKVGFHCAISGDTDGNHLVPHPLSVKASSCLSHVNDEWKDFNLELNNAARIPQLAKGFLASVDGLNILKKPAIILIH